MSQYDAVVYDLDGTLVALDVDWEVVAVEVLELYVTEGVEAPSDRLWELLSASERVGLRNEVETVIAEHERAGARTSDRLPLADELSTRSVPVGVCSLNCEAACRIALKRHDLDAAVDAVVGRDSVETRKPDPEPLLAVTEDLAADPERTLFVGDSESDETTAERAGTDFRYVDDRASR
ncbi:HAD family hydrolase [Halovivax sp.]|uniref:HAD family hydrolase n=1 Tax=Halovivax sp. TaxID=1935978 RepID=UPI0025B8756B|nr:HAD-IA family hydrolase [Halovivax sp.]